MSRRLERCQICMLPIRRDHESEAMADASRVHKICFDILCVGLAADPTFEVGEHDIVEVEAAPGVAMKIKVQKT